MGIFTKLKKVFSKEYRYEVGYNEMFKKNKEYFKLKDDDFNVDESIERLKSKKFKNNYEISKENLNITSSSEKKSTVKPVEKEK